MESGDDVYQVLGVSETASDADIKKAYRKLALKHHPDRQTTSQSQEAAHHVFAKISNAYEILSDPVKKREYTDARRSKSSNGNGNGSNSRRTDPRNDSKEARQYHSSSDADNFDNDDYYDGGRRRRRSSKREPPLSVPPSSSSSSRYRNARPAQSSSQRRPTHHDAFFSDLHDPFDVFERVFAQQSGNFGGAPRQQDPSPFDDPFFRSSPFGGGGGGGGFGPMFGGGGFGGSFGDIRNNNNRMMEPPFSTSRGGAGGAGGAGASMVSTSTTTRFVNGRRETVTERVVQHADGRVERQVLGQNDRGNDDHNDNHNHNHNDDDDTDGSVDDMEFDWDAYNHRGPPQDRRSKGIVDEPSSKEKRKQTTSRERHKPSSRHSQTNVVDLTGDSSSEEDQKPGSSHPPTIDHKDKKLKKRLTAKNLKFW